MQVQMILPKLHRPFLILILLAAGLVSAKPESAGVSAAGGVQLAPSSVPVDASTENAVLGALVSGGEALPEFSHYAITDVRLQGDWALVSIIGLAQVHHAGTWSLEDGAWFGVALLTRNAEHWTGALQGTSAFSELLTQVPESFIGTSSRADLDAAGYPRPRAGSPYVFPWEPGAAMFYGSLGIHANGFSSVVGGWKAVDMLSDGNSAEGHAPNRLLASEAGTLTYKCTDPNNVAVRISDFFYTHLENNDGLQTGSAFSQGAELGQMKTGSFGTQGAMCGWATQSDGWFHVHWGFPDADLNVQGWVLSMSSGNWTNGTQVLAPGGGWIAAGQPSSIHADTAGVFRPSTGALFMRNQNTTGYADAYFTYGIPGDYPIVGDWDGNGTTTLGVFRAGTFYLRNSNSNGFADLAFGFGAPGWQPIAGDWDGNGSETIGLYDSSTGTFFLRNSNDSGEASVSFTMGIPGDVGIAGDWNGDGTDTVGVFRPSNGALYLKNSNSTGFADIIATYGIPGDKPVTGDWDANGTDTIGIYRDGTFFLRNTNNTGFADLVVTLGIPGDVPIAGDWDGLP